MPEPPLRPRPLPTTPRRRAILPLPRKPQHLAHIARRHRARAHRRHTRATPPTGSARSERRHRNRRKRAQRQQDRRQPPRPPPSGGVRRPAHSSVRLTSHRPHTRAPDSHDPDPFSRKPAARIPPRTSRRRPKKPAEYRSRCDRKPLAVMAATPGQGCTGPPPGGFCCICSSSVADGRASGLPSTDRTRPWSARPACARIPYRRGVSCVEWPQAVVTLLGLPAQNCAARTAPAIRTPPTTGAGSNHWAEFHRRPRHGVPRVRRTDYAAYRGAH
jgi:hypothetical protein